MNTKKVETTLYKQALPIRSDETVSEFLEALRDAAKEYHNQTSGWAWLPEVRSDSMIICIELGEFDDWEMKYYKHSYTRNENGFSFGDGVEMKRVSMFVEVSDD